MNDNTVSNTDDEMLSCCSGDIIIEVIECLSSINYTTIDQTSYQLFREEIG